MYLRPRIAVAPLLLGLFLFAGLRAPAQELRSYLIVWPEVPGKQVDGSSLTYKSTNQRGWLWGPPGGYNGDGNDWRRDNPNSSGQPSAVTRLLERVRGGELSMPAGRFNYVWADNARTVVVVSVDLSRLPGLGGTGAAIEVLGAVHADDKDLPDARARLTKAINGAAFFLPGNVHGAGVKDALWDKLVRAVDPNKELGGAPFRVVYAWDSQLGEADALSQANVLLDEARALARALPREEKALAEMSRLYVAEKQDRAYELARKETYLPAAYALQAWQYINRDEHRGAGHLMILAEQALAKLERHVEGDPYFVLKEAQADLIGNPLGGLSDVAGQFLVLNRAYVSYTRGVIEAHLAQQTKDPAVRARHEKAREDAYAIWRNARTTYVNDPFLARSYGVAFYHGSRGLKRDLTTARNYFEQAEKLGSVDAKNFLGLYLSHFDGNQADPAAAVKKFEEAARLGSPPAKFNLGLLHLFGAGTPRDEARARQWIKDSGIKNNVVDTYLAGLLLEQWKASNAAGDELEITLLDEYPALLKTYGSTGGTGSEQLRFKVRYKIAGGPARIFPAHYDGELPYNQYSPSPLVQGTGEHIVWISNRLPNQWTGDILIRLIDENSKDVRLRVPVPVLARWDVGQRDEAAIAQAKEAEAAKLEQMNARFKEANAKFQAKDYAGAIALYDEIIATYPQADGALVQRGWAKSALNDAAGARADLDRAIAVNSQSAFTFMIRGRVRRVLQDDLPGALEDYNAALKLAPDDLETLFERAKTLQALERPDDARTDLDQFVARQPENAAGYYSRGLLARDQGRATAALADFARVLQLQPDHADARFEGAALKFRRHDWTGAQADFTRVLELLPNSTNTRRWLGYALYGAGDFKAAVEALTRAVEADKSAAGAYALLLRHYTLLRLGTPDQRLATAWGGWSDDPWAQALAKFAVGRLTETELEEQAAAGEEKERAGRACEMHFYAGLARLQAGDKSAARLHFQAAVATGKRDFVEYTLATAQLGLAPPAEPEDKPAAVQASTAATTPIGGQGTIRVTGKPDGAPFWIYPVDDQDRWSEKMIGGGNLTADFKIGAGRYGVLVTPRRSGNQSSRTEHRKIVTVRPGETVVVNADATEQATASGDSFEQAYVLLQTEPVYPPALLRAGIEGSVRVEVTIDASGLVTEARAYDNPNRAFVKAAEEAVREWRFMPAKQGGKAAPSRLQVTVNFKLPD